MKEEYEGKCGSCKWFYLHEKGKIFGTCDSWKSKARNKDSKSKLSKGCAWIERKDNGKN